MEATAAAAIQGGGVLLSRWLGWRPRPRSAGGGCGVEGTASTLRNKGKDFLSLSNLVYCVRRCSAGRVSVSPYVFASPRSLPPSPSTPCRLTVPHCRRRFGVSSAPRRVRRRPTITGRRRRSRTVLPAAVGTPSSSSSRALRWVIETLVSLVFKNTDHHQRCRISDDCGRSRERWLNYVAKPWSLSRQRRTFSSRRRIPTRDVHSTPSIIRTGRSFSSRTMVVVVVETVFHTIGRYDDRVF